MKRLKTSFISLIMIIAYFSLSATVFGEDSVMETPSREILRSITSNNSHTDSFSWQYEYEGKPNGLAGNSSPLISYYIKITGDAPYTLRMLLDGTEVNAQYDAASGNLTYQTANLTGTHEVEVQVDVYGQRHNIAAWSFTVDPSPTNPFEGKDQYILSSIQNEAITRMNEYRTGLALPLFSSSDTLQMAAQAHSNYLFANNVTGHYENPNGIGYTGDRPWDRGGYFGFSGNVGEGITYQKKTGSLGVDDLMDAPYHRLSIIDPRNHLAGTGYNNRGDIVINYGSSKSDEKRSEVVLYPYDKQTDAKVSWFVAENPNPLRFWGVDQTHVGYPISYAYFSDGWNEQLVVTNLSLKNEKNQDVPFYDVTPDRDNQGKHHVFLIPKSPLEPGQTYSVKVEAYVKDAEGIEKNVSRSWSFKTADSLKIHDIYFTTYQGINYLYLKMDSGEDPNAKVRIEKDGQLYMRKEDGRQWTYQPVSEGNFELTIESPLFKEIKVIPIRIQRNNEIRYDRDGGWLVQFDGAPIETIAPGVPAIDIVTNQSTTVTGHAEPSTIITVKQGEITIGTTRTAADGTFSMTLTPQAAGTVLHFTASDDHGNSSKPRIITVMDVIGLDNYHTWDTEKHVPANKEWTIRFNKEVDPKTVTLDTIYVHYNQQKVQDIEVAVNADRKSVTVKAPIGGYELGKTYFLYIEGTVTATSGEALSRPIKHKFSIQ